MADNFQEPTPAEVYANVRNRALEEAAQIVAEYASAEVGTESEWLLLMDKYNHHTLQGAIRALKTEPK